MDHKDSTDWSKELLTIARQSSDHVSVAHIVRDHTHAAVVEKRAATIAVLVSAAIAVLLRKDDSYFLSTAAATVWIFAASFGLVAITSNTISNIRIKRLRREHPARLRHIFQTIRTSIPELAPVVNQVEDKLFDSSPY